MNERIGYSLAGKDKGNVYYIVKVEGNNYWLSDGNRFPLEKPKKKNKKHLQLIKKYSLNEMLQISEESDISNDKIKTLCKNIFKDIQEVK